jgi:hypothetical protein
MNFYLLLGKDGVIERKDFLSSLFETSGFNEIDENNEYELLLQVRIIITHKSFFLKNLIVICNNHKFLIV